MLSALDLYTQNSGAQAQTDVQEAIATNAPSPDPYLPESPARNAQTFSTLLSSVQHMGTLGLVFLAAIFLLGYLTGEEVLRKEGGQGGK